jgi:hypothetical protein
MFRVLRGSLARYPVNLNGNTKSLSQKMFGGSSILRVSRFAIYQLSLFDLRGGSR